MSELQSLIRVFDFDISNLSGFKTVFVTDLACVFLGSLVSEHRAGRLLISRYIPALTLVSEAENNMVFKDCSGSVVFYLQRGHLTCSPLPGQADWALAGCLGYWLFQGADSDV